MKIGHEFHPMHGFTGSANPSTDMRPTVPGFKRGGMEEEMEHKEHGDHPKHDHAKHDEHGYQHHKGHGHKEMHKHHGGHKKMGHED